MKRLFGIVATLAFASVASVAQASDNAWFTLQSTTCVGAVVNESGPGHKLAITKLTNAGCDLVIGYNFTASSPGAGGQTMAGWALTLANPNPAFLSVSAESNVAVATYPNPLVGGINSGGNLLNNRGGLSTANNGASGLVYTFTLHYLSGKPNGTDNITGDFGATEQRYSNGFRWFGSVAGGPLSYGSQAYTGSVDNTPGWGPQAVISITNPVPEPASIALLGFGVMALIRRRK